MNSRRNLNDFHSPEGDSERTDAAPRADGGVEEEEGNNLGKKQDSKRVNDPRMISSMRKTSYLNYS